MGLDAELPDDDAWILPVDIFFGTAFAVEMVLRMLALELRFFYGPEWAWNLFDAVLVSCSVILSDAVQRQHPNLQLGPHQGPARSPHCQDIPDD